MYKALTFDVYGTLIDWESGMIAGLKPLTDQVDLSRNAILEAHAYHESTIQAQTPAKLYPSVLAGVYKRLAEELGLKASWGEALTYGASVEHWPAFEDSAEALARLKTKFKLVIVSNVDNASVQHSIAKLGDPFDVVVTAEDAGSYKPALGHFEVMERQLARMGIEKGEILHVAESLFHDHGPANKRGLDNCWIYRRHDQEGFGATMDPGKQPKIDMRYNSMAEFADAILA